MVIEIEKNFPVPMHANAKYPFAQMEVGDSFFVDKDRQLLSATASSYGTRHNKKFRCAKENNGTRVWRIA